MEIVYTIDNTRNYPKTIIKILTAVATLHGICFIVFYTLKLATHLEKRFDDILTVYVGTSEAILAIIHICICVVLVKFWRDKGAKNKLVGCLKLLFVLMIYMALSLLLRMWFNLLMINGVFEQHEGSLTYIYNL